MNAVWRRGRDVVSEGLSQFFGGAVCCGTCRFYKASAAPHTGDCRRYPPTVMTQYDRVQLNEASGARGQFFYGFVNEFPLVQAEMWCGEYQPPAEPKP